MNILEPNSQVQNIVIDTSFFIRLKELTISDSIKYHTTPFIISEIKDEKARSHYTLNKEFIQVTNPNREHIKFISTFANESNDLKTLSIPDISILALAYELIIKEKKQESLRSKPLQHNIIEEIQKMNQTNENEKITKNETKEDEEGFVEVKSKKKQKLKEFTFDENDEGEWITKENINEKLFKNKKQK